MTNWLFGLFFLFLLLMFFQQSFDPAMLKEPHHKCLPLQDIFITARLDVKHLHANAATDKRGCYQQGPGGQTRSIKLLVVGYRLTLDEFSAVNKITTNPLVLVCELWLRGHSRPWETSLCLHQPEVQYPSKACGKDAIFGTRANIWIIHLILFLKTHLIPACLSLHTSTPPCSRDCWAAARYISASRRPQELFITTDQSLIRSRLFLLEPVCFLISHWDAYMPWHDRALSSSTSFSIRVLRQRQAQVAMHWGTPATLSHISVGKQRFTEGKIFHCALLWFIPFWVLIISKWCLFFLLFSLSHEFIHTSKKSNQTEENEMQSKSFHSLLPNYH